MGQLKEKFISMPFAFTGMGIFRVWTETVYSNGAVVFPAQETGYGFAFFNLLAAAILLAMALLSKKIGTLYGKCWVAPVASGFLAASASLNFASLYVPSYAFALGLPAVVLGATGIALIILAWSELFSCLNPLRVGLYFSGGLVVGALLLWLFKGLATPWLWVCVCLVPVASFICLKKAYAYLPSNERPHASWGHHSFPWKPIAIVVLYSFSYGLCENVFGSFLGIHSGLGCVFAAALVYLTICWRKEGFSFSFTYKVACPLMILSLVPFSFILSFGGELSAFFALAGYTLVLIAIMVIMSNLCYQHGFNAIWLFGIERAVRLISVQAGIGAKDVLVGYPGESLLGLVVIGVTVAAMIVLATYVFLSELSMMSPWSATLQQGVLVDAEDFAGDERQRMGEKCSEMAETFRLTAREEEVLLLLAQGKKPVQIERELYVASSTVKTHIKHLYQKLDVHSRKEMFELMGLGVE